MERMAIGWRAGGELSGGAGGGAMSGGGAIGAGALGGLFAGIGLALRLSLELGFDRWLPAERLLLPAGGASDASDEGPTGLPPLLRRCPGLQSTVGGRMPADAWTRWPGMGEALRLLGWLETVFERLDVGDGLPTAPALPPVVAGETDREAFEERRAAGGLGAAAGLAGEGIGESPEAEPLDEAPLMLRFGGAGFAGPYPDDFTGFLALASSTTTSPIACTGLRPGGGFTGGDASQPLVATGAPTAAGAAAGATEGRLG